MEKNLDVRIIPSELESQLCPLAAVTLTLQGIGERACDLVLGRREFTGSLSSAG